MEDNTELTVQHAMINVCDNMKVNLGTAGAFLNEEAARASLQCYFEQPGVPAPDDPDHIYGHTFGLDTMKEFISNIDTYNSNISNETDRINAIRVYYGMSQRHDPDFPLNPKDGYFKDVFFMPVLATGEDLYKIHHLLPAVPVLGESRPCPNQCGLGFL